MPHHLYGVFGRCILGPSCFALVVCPFVEYGEVSLSHYAIKATVSRLESILWYFDNTQRIKEAVQKIKEHRLLELMQIDKTRRIHDDLSRTFFRALSELRKHQEWRRKMQIVDIPEQEGEA